MLYLYTVRYRCQGHLGEHKEVWGYERRGPALSYPDDAIAQTSRAGGQSRVVGNGVRRPAHCNTVQRNPRGTVKDEITIEEHAEAGKPVGVPQVVESVRARTHSNAT